MVIFRSARAAVIAGAKLLVSSGDRGEARRNGSVTELSALGVSKVKYLLFLLKRRRRTHWRILQEDFHCARSAGCARLASTYARCLPTQWRATLFL